MTTSLSLGALGALAGLTAACGGLLIVSALRRRRPTLEDRLAPYATSSPRPRACWGRMHRTPMGALGARSRPCFW